MEGLTALGMGGRFPAPFSSPARRSLSLSHRSPSCFRVLASGEGPELDKWDQMELKFGRLLGEDPKLTLAKIMARKANPDVSYLEVEKSFVKSKGKLDKAMFNIPDDVNVERKPSAFPKENGLNLSRPVMKNTAKSAAGLNLNLSRPVLNKGVTSPAKSNLTQAEVNRGLKATRPAAHNRLPPDGGDDKSVTAPPNVALRKPDIVQEDDVPDKPSKLRIKANLTLKMRNDMKEDVTVPLLQKPEVVKNPDQEIPSSSEEGKALNDEVKPSSLTEMLHDKPLISSPEEPSNIVSDSKSYEFDGLVSGLQPPEENCSQSDDVGASGAVLDDKPVKTNEDSHQAPLLGKPQRLDLPAKEVVQETGEVVANLNDKAHSSDAYVALPVAISAEQEELEGNDWRRAEHLLQTGERTEVEFISCSSRGFVVSFGSIVGFLPYRNVGAKWKFLAFESWLRQKGLDPSLYRQKLSIIGSYDTPNKSPAVQSEKKQERSKKDEATLTPDMTFEDILEAYDKEKSRFLSSFIGQRIKVSVLLADRKSRRLMFTGRPREKEELVEKKRSLMAKLSVGDVVKCCIKKITYFGIFVEVEGVPALIHQTEVSWDATLDPSAYYKIGQIVEAKVHQLDYALERIFLSLKEITPDPLMEALESVIGDRTSLGGSLEVAAEDTEPWADVESLIEELKQFDGVQSVLKGRFFLSPGLAPTFQVYMASVFDNQYKLLARYGNKVQEVIVQASLDKEQMKTAILVCTNRVQ